MLGDTVNSKHWQLQSGSTKAHSVPPPCNKEYLSSSNYYSASGLYRRPSHFDINTTELNITKMKNMI